MTEIERRVRSVVADVLWVAAGDFDPDGSLTDYGLDSPTSIELTIQLERTFGISIPEDVAARLTTVGAIVRYVEAAA
ncbi:acyl carrier protein [Nocardia arthritidis]|uniref:acyl carrier protein n=1 Tax=Nocardia arthritidis TaxID=228602 RepID=UPI00142DD1DE|nr:acyl carrier protein [Nocardia arthritidis]